MHILFLYALILLSRHVLLSFSHIIQILHVCRPAVASTLKKIYRGGIAYDVKRQLYRNIYSRIYIV
jgi:DNA-binding transcriptional regulator GbsR (MarR family)